MPLSLPLGIEPFAGDTRRRCESGVMIAGEYFPCDYVAAHDGWSHSSRRAEALWPNESSTFADKRTIARQIRAVLSTNGTSLRFGDEGVDRIGEVSDDAEDQAEHLGDERTAGAGRGVLSDDQSSVDLLEGGSGGVDSVAGVVGHGDGSVRLEAPGAVAPAPVGPVMTVRPPSGAGFENSVSPASEDEGADGG